MQSSQGLPPATATNTTAQNSSVGLSQEKIPKQCILCGSKDKQMSRYTNWGAVERKFLSTYLDSNPAESSFICKSHLMEARRHHDNPDFVPKWKPGPRSIQQPLNKCVNPKCIEPVHEKLIKPSFAPIAELEEILGVKSSADNPLVLCQQCYNILYRQLHPSKPCASCGATPKMYKSFCRHSPNALVVSQHLATTAGIDIQIGNSDYICTNCYKVHCNIIKSLESQQNGSDNMLHDSIEIWKHTAENTTELVTKATLAAVMYVAKHLLQKKAVLLPWACRIFLQVYNINYTGSVNSVELCLELGESNVRFSSRWLLHQLIVYLDSYMLYKCVHKKFGTILFCKGVDVLISLSWALGMLDTTESYSEPTTIQHSSTSVPNEEQVLTYAGSIVNDIIHKEIKKTADGWQLDPTVFSVDDYMQNINPLLVQFLFDATSTVRERQHCNKNEHAKQVRIFFIICLLQFCTNTKPTLIHHLLSDVVEVCGGSRQLIRILNRLGCVSSPDTHDRFVTEHAQIKRQRSIWEEIPHNVFTVASVDNFDMLQSYSAVYCGDQQRSFHGTTVQLVQPDPNSTFNSQHMSRFDHTVELPTVDTHTNISTQPSNMENNNSVTADSSNENLAITTEQISNQSFPSKSARMQKRQGRLSPTNSPHKLGKVGPKRQRTIAVKNLSKSLHENISSATSHNTTDTTQITLTIQSFQGHSDEKNEEDNLQCKLQSYIVQKYIVDSYPEVNSHDGVLSELRQFLNEDNYYGLQVPSTVHYLELVDENPDSSETMCLIAEDILDKFGDEVQNGWVLLVGDGKTYKHLMNIKKQYSSALEKLLIFPGDWHILKNYQPILMKVYYNAGLKELASSSGYHGATLKSLENCTNFKRTHRFILQVWEAIYREMYHTYFLHNDTDLIQDAKCIISTSITEKHPPHHLMIRISQLLEDDETHKKFKLFMEQLIAKDNTLKFWYQFIFMDCFCYLSLYLAIRSSNWKLRLSSLKMMVPLFSAFDRDFYERIIPHHLADIELFPPEILKCLMNGGFTVSITGQRWCAVALDEAHEMCINKDLKAAVIRPTTSYLQKTTLFFNYRIKAYKNIIHELFPEKDTKQSTSNTIIDSTPQSYQGEENIKQMCSLIRTKNLLMTTTNRGILNVFSGQKATPEQEADMLNFRHIGTQAYLDYVTHHILHQPSSVKAPLRRHKLLTMKPVKSYAKRRNPKDQESRQVIKCLRRKLAWSNHGNIQYDESDEQYSVLPRAIADEDGNPHKSSKSNWSDKLATRYGSSDPPVFTSHLPFVPQVAIIDAMFMLNTRPLRQTKTLSDYTKFLFNQFALQHYKTGVNEVHLIFDKPGRQQFNPKQFEHHKRSLQHKTVNEHQHYTFMPHSTIPNGWQAYLECRQCKRSIVEAIGLSIMQQGRFLLKNHQRLLIAGSFTGDGEDLAWLISTNEITPERLLEYQSNAEEADNRMWRHAIQSPNNDILIYSPDTDVYNIGLHLVTQPSKNYIIQLNIPHSLEKKYVNLKNLNMAFTRDPDLSTLPTESLGAIMQTLFICTGCDYVSYFKTFGKATILNIFFQHSQFISGTDMPGSLHHTNTTSKETGFLSFMRLVGTCYFKRHLAAFIASKGHETPFHLYNSLDTSLSNTEKHTIWIQEIRKVVSERILNEEERLPSTTSLWRHWLRSCWVSQMWQNSSEQDMYNPLPLPEESGWMKSDGCYVIDWEAPEVQDKVRKSIDFLLKGCSCKKGCRTTNCGCRKKARYCGPACLCQECVNLQQIDENGDDICSNTDEETTDESDLSAEEQCIEDEIITDNEIITEDLPLLDTCYDIV